MPSIKTPELAAMEERIESLREENISQIEANLVLKEENEKLKAKVAELTKRVEAKAAATVEIVAIPGAGIKKVPDLYFGDEACERKDEDGYTHFFVPRRFAETLLTNTCGMKYVLTGQKEPLKARRHTGLTVEEVTVYPYVFDGSDWKQVNAK